MDTATQAHRAATRRLPLRASLALLAALFVSTGATGLLAEQCFEKLLSAEVGSSTPAAAMVLAAYFLGLTLGNFAYGKRLAARRNPLRNYAALEAGVGAWALLLSLGVPVASTPLLRLGAGNFAVLETLRFLVACLWILPPAALMGATFPAVVDVLRVLRAPQPRRMMSRFYFWNLLGAIAAALGAPYWTFPTIGLRGTLLLTAAIDLSVAAAAFAFSRTLAQAGPSPEAAPGPALPAPRVLAAVALASGFIGLGLEVLWTHLIAAVLGNSIYSFAAMLALVLLGLGLGAALASALFSERKGASAAAVGATLVLAGLLLLAQHRQWPAVSQRFITWGAGLQRFSDGELLRFIQGALLLLPAATALGVVYPSLFRMRELPREARVHVAATLGAWNAVGCVSGALCTGFLLIPWLGSEGTSTLFGVGTILAGMALAAARAQRAGRAAVLIFGLAAAALWTREPLWDRLALTAGGNIYFSSSHVDPATRLLTFYEDTLGGITTVVAQPPGQRIDAPESEWTRVLLTNGKFQASDKGETLAQTGFGVIPSLHTAGREAALVIGLGGGQSARVVRDLGFAHIDIAELSPGNARAADESFGALNGHILEQPGVELHLEDGRNFLLLNHRTYDLIEIELTSIWFAGATMLYAREFYREAREHLRPGGILQQWVQLHHISLDEIGSAVATLRDTFPYVSFWYFGEQGVLIASMEPQQIRSEVVSGLLRNPPWPRGTAEERLAELLSSRLLSPGDVDHLLTSAPFVINTDWNRYIEYATPRYNLVRQELRVRNRLALLRHSSFAVPELDRAPAPELQPLLARAAELLESARKALARR